MFKGVRIDLIAYTASFRVPCFVGHQITLPVPPLSTIYGIISAATGRIVRPEEVEWLAYRLKHEGVASDLEAIFSFERDNELSPAKPGKRNVIQREFLLLPHLTLYLPVEWRGVFERPRYPLLLGRTQDLATVDRTSEVELEEVEDGEVEGVLLPREVVFQQAGVPCVIYNLPISFTEDPNRQPLGVGIFGAVTKPCHLRAPGWLIRDAERDQTVPIYRKGWICDAIGGTAGQIR